MAPSDPPSAPARPAVDVLVILAAQQDQLDALAATVKAQQEAIEILTARLDRQGR